MAGLEPATYGSKNMDSNRQSVIVWAGVLTESKPARLRELELNQRPFGSKPKIAYHQRKSRMICEECLFLKSCPRQRKKLPANFDEEPMLPAWQIGQCVKD
ncbi:hypothetical protein DTL21_14895 [Bremerella cremea]|uniref:Uncharacterized protein n=1 Tax=Blastopirellula marina TaxID=124 RepID=A0A2S8FRH3_9BACT|nr:hypothetical protein C5Y83_14885 [Blastopirellula marina]RCS47281.1 hypothetical protein DTL21_14895 [Bremerella cremea]